MSLRLGSIYLRRFHKQSGGMKRNRRHCPLEGIGKTASVMRAIAAGSIFQRRDVVIGSTARGVRQSNGRGRGTLGVIHI